MLHGYEVKSYIFCLCTLWFVRRVLLTQKKGKERSIVYMMYTLCLLYRKGKNTSILHSQIISTYTVISLFTYSIFSFQLFLSQTLHQVLKRKCLRYIQRHPEKFEEVMFSLVQFTLCIFHFRASIHVHSRTSAKGGFVCPCRLCVLALHRKSILKYRHSDAFLD